MMKESHQYCLEVVTGTLSADYNTVGERFISLHEYFMIKSGLLRFHWIEIGVLY